MRKSDLGTIRRSIQILFLNVTYICMYSSDMMWIAIWKWNNMCVIAERDICNENVVRCLLNYVLCCSSIVQRIMNETTAKIMSQLTTIEGVTGCGGELRSEFALRIRGVSSVSISCNICRDSPFHIRTDLWQTSLTRAFSH
jgi:hypothetical protein